MSGAVEGVALLPCPNPWCEEVEGVEASRHITTEKWHVCCDDCMIEGPWADNYELAVAAWNTRTTPPARSYADGVADVVNLCRQWSEPGAKVLSSMSGLTDAEHAIAQRTAEGIAEAASGLLSQGGKA